MAALNDAGVKPETMQERFGKEVLTLVEGVTGLYFEDGQEAVPYSPGVRRGVAAFALDPVKAERLWEVSLNKLAE